MEHIRTRFLMLCLLGAISVGLMLGVCSSVGAAASSKSISPTEDLLREHAVISRLLLIFDESNRRLRANQVLQPQVLTQSCDIIRRFVQDYHEKNEEQYVFTDLEKKHMLTDVTRVLRQQHDAGRRVIDGINSLATAGNFQDPVVRGRLEGMLSAFARMYEPHKAREGSVVFPAFHKAMSAKYLDKLGETFEDNEHKRFGKDGFERIVGEVAGIEKSLGIYDLSQFTPKQGV